MRKEITIISIIVPSRGRPHRLKILLDSIRNKSNNIDNYEIIVGLDEDEIHKYNKLKIEDNTRICVGKKNRTMGQITLDCINQSKGKFLFLCNDDVIFHTQNWNSLLADKLLSLKDINFLAYPNDGIKKKSLSTFPIFKVDLLKKNPELLPKDYKGACIDLHILDIFKGFQKGKNIFYLDNILCEHMHYSKNKNLFDETYANRNRFGDDCLFIAFSDVRRKISHSLNNNLGEVPHPSSTLNLFSLLKGKSNLSWKLKLFIYMLLRHLYSKYIYKFKH